MTAKAERRKAPRLKAKESSASITVSKVLVRLRAAIDQPTTVMTRAMNRLRMMRDSTAMISQAAASLIETSMIQAREGQVY